MSMMKAATAALLWIASWMVCGASGRSTSNTPAAIRLSPASASRTGKTESTPRWSMAVRSRNASASAVAPKA